MKTTNSDHVVYILNWEINKQTLLFCELIDARLNAFLKDLKFGFSEKATKFGKIFVVLLTRSQEHCVLCVQQRIRRKVDEDFLKKMCTSHIIQTLPV